MIGCLIIVQLVAVAEFKHAQFDVGDQLQAERMAAMHAGQLASRHGDDGSSRFGFRCGDGEWIAMGLELAEVFGTSRHAAKTAKNS